MNVSLGNDTAKSLSEQILFNIQLYYTPVLVILGTLGNCLSVFVFFYTKLRKLSSSYYLAALALSDTVVLLTVFYIWLTLIDVTDFNTPVKCQLMVFITYVSSFLSSWFVVAFTVERFIAVQFPLRRPSMCTVTRAKIVLVFLTMFAVLAYSPYSIIAGIVTREDGHKTCQPYPEFKFINTLYHHFDMLVTFLLPFLVISVLNAWIGRTVLRVEIDRSRLTTRSRGNHERLRPASAHTKVTKMLLIVSTCFLLLNFPSYVIRTIIFFTEEEENENNNNPNEASPSNMVIIQHVSMLLFHTNFGINFVLYCISGQNFRRALVSLCCPELFHVRGRRDTTQVTGRRDLSVSSRAKLLFSQLSVHFNHDSHPASSSVRMPSIHRVETYYYT